MPQRRLQWQCMRGGVAGAGRAALQAPVSCWTGPAAAQLPLRPHILLAANPALLEPEVAHFYDHEPARDPRLLVQVGRHRPDALLLGHACVEKGSACRALVLPAAGRLTKQGMPGCLPCLMR